MCLVAAVAAKCDAINCAAWGEMTFFFNLVDVNIGTLKKGNLKCVFTLFCFMIVFIKLKCFLVNIFNKMFSLLSY